jgi:hypothetical protein
VCCPPVTQSEIEGLYKRFRTLDKGYKVRCQLFRGASVHGLLTLAVQSLHNIAVEMLTQFSTLNARRCLVASFEVCVAMHSYTSIKVPVDVCVQYSIYQIYESSTTMSTLW